MRYQVLVFLATPDAETSIPRHEVLMSSMAAAGNGRTLERRALECEGVHSSTYQRPCF